MRRQDSGESDRRLTLLTDEYGKVDVVAKGARKGGSRLAGASEPFVLAEFTWAEGRSRRFVMQARPRTSFPRVRADYDRLTAALAWCELLAQAITFDSPSGGLLEEAVGVAHCFEESPDPAAVFAWGMVRLLEAEGIGPSWINCVLTGDTLQTGTVAVSPMAGGYVSVDQAAYADAVWTLAEVAITAHKLGELDAPPRQMKRRHETVMALVRYWEHVVERQLPACESFARSLEGSTE
ncbi:MAG: DNA repair protein RecO [Armatimonadetes bacterium]|nr:DNA repair protein RecO [Armatimonadota bacterium]